jgi:hypothetical protein
MRCPDCGKFVPFDTEAEPEANLEIDSEGQMSGNVRRVLPCGECGTELKETTFDIDQDLSEILQIEGKPASQVPCTSEDQQHEWDWEHAEEPMVSADSRMEDKDRHGKKIKSSRYMTQYYGVLIEGNVTCKNCATVAAYEVKDEASASSFDELT